MDSLNNTTDNPQSDEVPQSSAETNQPGEKKLKRVVSLSQKRKNRKLRPWKQWMAQTARIRYSLPPSNPEESSYNLRNLFDLSSDMLTPIARRQESFYLNIFNMPVEQKAKIEEQLKSQGSSGIKVEILNVTAKQHVKTEDFPKSEIIVISDSDSEKEDTSLKTTREAFPLIDRAFYQQTTTSVPVQLLAENSLQSVSSDNPRNSKVDILNMPPLQKPKTEEYLRSQTSSTVKVEVFNPAPTQSAMVKIIGTAPKQEEKKIVFENVAKVGNLENNSNSIEKDLQILEAESCETCSKSCSHQNITVKIYYPPSAANLKAQDSNIIKFEVVRSPQEKGISTEDSDIIGTQNSHQEPGYICAICEEQGNSELITATSTTNTDSDLDPLAKEESKSSKKLNVKMSNRSSSLVQSVCNNRNPEMNFCQPNSLPTLQTNTERKPLSFKQKFAQILGKAGEAATQTTKILNANLSTQISSATTVPLTSKSGFLTLRQRQMELHRLRVQVEQKRLELLNLKLSRELNEIQKSKVEFDKNNIVLDDCTDI